MTLVELLALVLLLLLLGGLGSLQKMVLGSHLVILLQLHRDLLAQSLVLVQPLMDGLVASFARGQDSGDLVNFGLWAALGIEKVDVELLLGQVDEALVELNFVDLALQLIGHRPVDGVHLLMAIVRKVVAMIRKLVVQQVRRPALIADQIRNGHFCALFARLI